MTHDYFILFCNEYLFNFDKCIYVKPSPATRLIPDFMISLLEGNMKQVSFGHSQTKLKRTWFLFFLSQFKV